MVEFQFIFCVVNIIIIYHCGLGKCAEWSFIPTDGHLDLGDGDDNNVKVTLQNPFKFKDILVKDFFVSYDNSYCPRHD